MMADGTGGGGGTGADEFGSILTDSRTIGNSSWVGVGGVTGRFVDDCSGRGTDEFGSILTIPNTGICPPVDRDVLATADEDDGTSADEFGSTFTDTLFTIGLMLATRRSLPDTSSAFTTGAAVVPCFASSASSNRSSPFVIIGRCPSKLPLRLSARLLP